MDSLAREILISLSRLYPGRFLLIGGGALHLLHGSPRSSADLDFASPDPLSHAELKTIAAALAHDLSRLPSWAEEPPSCSVVGHSIEVRARGLVPVLVQFPALPVVTAGGDRRLVTGESLRTELVVVPTLDSLLLSKAVALLKRPAAKGRDAFDIWFLRERGAKLDAETFDAWRRWEELEAGAIAARLGQLTPKRLKADLARYLPEELGRRLESAGYSPLISAARDLLAPWLED